MYTIKYARGTKQEFFKTLKKKYGKFKNVKEIFAKFLRKFKKLKKLFRNIEKYLPTSMSDVF